jgi:hypothetical protein
MIDKIHRIKLFSELSGKQFLGIEDLDGEVYWFLCDRFTEANPSNHIHYHELIGRDITGIINSNIEMDKDLLLTKLSELVVFNLKFPVQFKWLRVM